MFMGKGKNKKYLENNNNNNNNNNKINTFTQKKIINLKFTKFF